MKNINRRTFLRGAGGAAGSSWLTFNMPLLIAVGQTACTAKEAKAAFKNLSTTEAREFAAISEQIFPTTDTPGADAAGVIYFIDEMLGGFMAGAAEFLKKGVAELLAETDGKFATLPFDAQTKLLQAREQTPFFRTMRFLTISGMFCMPAQGGNKDHIGWQLLNFDHQHTWQPPFGYYDTKEGNANG